MRRLFFDKQPHEELRRKAARRGLKTSRQPTAADASRARIDERSSTGRRIACPVQRTEPDDALPIVTSAIDSGCIEPNASHNC